MIKDITAQEARRLTFESVKLRRIKNPMQQRFDALVEELSLKIQHYASKGLAKLTYRLTPYSSAIAASLMKHFRERGFAVTLHSNTLTLTW